MIAPAGAGTPTKKAPFQAGRSERSSDTLKRASRSAEQTAKTSTAIQPRLRRSSSAQLNMMMAGATPKLTKSARLSSSAPKREEAFRSRATCPSMPSRNAANTSAATAKSQRCSMPMRIAVSPAHSPSSVKMLGISTRTGTWPRAKTRCRRLRSSLSGSKGGNMAALNLPLTDKRREHRLGANRCLPNRGQELGVGRKIKVNPAAEADQADALALLHASPLAHESHDPPRHQPGDQHHADLGPGLGLDDQRLPLILLAGLVKFRVEESTGDIGAANDLSAHGRAHDVHVEDGQKHRHPRQRLGAERKFPWCRHTLDHSGDLAVGGADDQPRPVRRHPLGIAEEVSDECGEQCGDPAERRRQQE